MFKDFYRNKKVLVTGHTGFKGSWLTIWLNMLGAKVYGYALKPVYNPNNYTASKVKNICVEKIGDIRNEIILKAYINKIKPEIIFHLAAQPLVRESYQRPKYTYETNIIGLINLFESVREINSVKNLIVITSDKCYENIETDKGYDENSKLGGADPYSSSKACAEIITSAYYRSFFKEKGIKTSTVRAGNVIGGGDWSKDRLIPDCMRSLSKKKKIVIRNPESTRPWQHVLEPLSGYLWLCVRMGEWGDERMSSWNFGPELKEKRSVIEVAEMVNKIWINKNLIKVEKNNNNFHEAGLLYLDISKAKRELNWRPVWNINNTLKKTVEWYKKYYSDKFNMFDICLNQIQEYYKSAQLKNLPWTT